ncbi:nuclear transport factor 2 family protein [Curtobacterium oceanosedimentum]|uniref:SnoaL-like domain-containing protein n=1 Tax=Curtobacterium oceanosedimentum TaxID=465820 RepID=A0A147DSU6_9MICO|nr:nuclear transport factor 2 family protein [Curtobacterium oceanosedimentum]KTR53049.1 hypothetical protein NS359_04340 [Curtobacterium oceanosedimentum]
MTLTQLVDAYLSALGSADVDAVLALFTPDAIVSSPLYGEHPARDFYPTLFADTAASVLTLRRTFVGTDESAPTVAFWFDFDWTLADGTPAPFSVVDVAELDQQGQIQHLHIVYDANPIRTVWEAQQADREPRS